MQMWNGLSWWINRELTMQLASYPHILQSNEHVCNLMRTWQSHGDSDSMVRINVQAFFMQGESWTLARCIRSFCMRHFELEKAELIADAAGWLLDNQYVQSRFLPGRLWKVMRGSGMGLPCSSSIADIAIHELAEKHWASCAMTQQLFGIKLWVRFCDDIFMVSKGRWYPFFTSSFVIGLAQPTSLRW